MRDLLIITPARAREANALRLIDAVATTATAQTDLVLAVDDDDRSYDLLVVPDWVSVVQGPRQTCPAWTNQIALEQAGNYRALASLGDDHVPVTCGWDELLLGALDTLNGTGTGIAYGDDLYQHEHLPTAPVISSDIVQALGWMMYPEVRHFYADNIWKNLALAEGCLAYLPQVIIQHLHYSSGTAPMDTTYTEAHTAWSGDTIAYHNWRRYERAADAEKIGVLLTARSR